MKDTFIVYFATDDGKPSGIARHRAICCRDRVQGCKTLPLFGAKKCLNIPLYKLFGAINYGLGTGNYLINDFTLLKPVFYYERVPNS